MVLNQTTCEISGTPSGYVPQTSVLIRASNSLGYMDAIITILVNGQPSISYGVAQYWRVGVPIAPLFPMTNGAPITSCSISPNSPPLPPGFAPIVLNQTTCGISGTPSAPAAANTYIIRASNAYGYTEAPITVTISP
jgi:hypothetical protein